MNDIRARLSSLSAEKRKLLELKLQRRNVSAIERPPLLRRSDSGPAPLSYSQQRLWFLDQLDPRSTQYSIPYAVELKGRVNFRALSRTLDEIVARHEALRTTFMMKNSVAMQHVSKPQSVQLRRIDLRGADDPRRQVALMNVLKEEVSRPFDLTRDLLLRAALVDVRPDESVLLLVLHHIAADAWSFGVLFREFAALYESFAGERENPLPPLRVQYSDFSVWQRSWLCGEVLDRQLEYWRKQLAGISVLQLPTDKPRPSVMTYAGRRHPIALSRRLSDQLKALARRENVTEYMLLLTAFSVLLGRYSGQQDVAIGSPIANRNQVEVEELIGFFVNTLVMRNDLSGDPAFRELLQRSRDMTLAAYAHQDVPFEKLVEELQPERDRSQNPLFQVVFALQNAPGNPLRLPDLTLTPLPLHDGNAKFDLTLILRETKAGFSGFFEYRTDLFEHATIERMAAHFEVLLNGIVAEPEASLSQLPLLTQAEHLLIADEWGKARASYPSMPAIHKLFEEVVERSPDAIAVVFENEVLTYRTLNARANQLARLLRANGVRPQSLVGLCVERSPELIVATLAILKAGGVYVPLDPSYPPERLRLMLDDTRAPVVVTQTHLASSLPSSQAVVLELESIQSELAALPADNLPCEVSGESLAYVIYTSGSTGKPKGICIPQKAVNRLVRNTNYVQLTPADKVAQVSNASFDAATFEIWGALLNGGTLVIIRKDIALSPRDFIEALRREKISAMFLTTALFNLLIAENPAAFSTLDHVMFGGEAVDAKRVREALRGGPPKRLLHVYGPTEVTTFSTWHLVQDVPEDAVTVPIGRPLSNTECYVLDPHLNVLPAGVPGELYLGGDGVARGYLNRPELTAEKFVRHPFSRDPGATLYKSGDIVRYLPNGDIEFIGRRDHQVKIRGFRIELGEIEAALLEHASVKECIVMAREDSPGERRVVAYVVLKQDVERADLRRYIAERMPDYMVPSAVVELDAMPLNVNGKVDRKALPAPDRSRFGLRQRVGPRSPLQHQLVEIWEEVLGAKGIGTTDDFFDLGGHSLLAVRMMDRVEQVCGRKVPLTTLFAGATIEHLARELLHQSGGTDTSPYMKIQSDGRNRPLFFLHGDINSAGLYCVNLARNLGAEQPVYALHPHGCDGKIFDASIETMAAEHLRIIRAIDPKGPYLVGGFCAAACVAFEVARQLQTDGRNVEHLVLVDIPPLRRTPRMIRRAVEWSSLFSRATVFEKMEKFARWVKGYRRIQRFARSGLKEKLELALRKATGGLKNIAESPANALAASDIGMRNIPREIALAYRWSLAGYRPAHYAGRVSFVFSSDVCAEHGELAGGWEKYASNSSIYAVPGDHQSCRTTHNHSLAEQIRQCLSIQPQPVAMHARPSDIRLITQS